MYYQKKKKTSIEHCGNKSIVASKPALKEGFDSEMEMLDDSMLVNFCIKPKKVDALS